MMSTQERKAREAVVLPYEHMGRAKAYQTGDWKDYLPVAAGGRASGAHGAEAAGAPAGMQPAQLGAITYVRDSDEEDGGLHDSDEDPDDDLDI